MMHYLLGKKAIDLLHDESFCISEFRDQENGGHSESRISRGPDGLTVKLMLEKGFCYPYSGIVINKKDYQRFSIDGYHFKLKLKSNDDVRLSLRFNQLLKGYSKENDCNTQPIFTKTIGLHKGENHIDQATDEITEVPNWWVYQNPKALSLVNNVILDNTLQIWIFCEKNETLPLNKEITLNIEEFSMERDFYWLYYLLAMLAYYAVAVAVWQIRRRIKASSPANNTSAAETDEEGKEKETKKDEGKEEKEVKIVLAPVQKIEIATNCPKPDQWQQIMAYIGNNYSNPNLKLADVAEVTDVTENDVSELLREGTGKNFRQYLNFVRMNEAARLLKQSGLQIAEIATAVGYNNTQHFNRVFKEFFEVSPKQYRG
jgi:AraC-like DNA-binding protein